MISNLRSPEQLCKLFNIPLEELEKLLTATGTKWLVFKENHFEEGGEEYRCLGIEEVLRILMFYRLQEPSYHRIYSLTTHELSDVVKGLIPPFPSVE